MLNLQASKQLFVHLQIFSALQPLLAILLRWHIDSNVENTVAITGYFHSIFRFHKMEFNASKGYIFYMACTPKGV